MKNNCKIAILVPDLNQNYHKMYKTISEKESTGRKPMKTLNPLLHYLLEIVCSEMTSYPCQLSLYSCYEKFKLFYYWCNFDKFILMRKNLNHELRKALTNTHLLDGLIYSAALASTFPGYDSHVPTLYED